MSERVGEAVGEVKAVLSEAKLRALSTPALVRRAAQDVRLLVQNEMLYARRELEAEFGSALRAGLLLAGATLLALWGGSLWFVSLALALPLKPALAALFIGAGLLTLGLILGLLGRQALPKRPLPETRKRLHEELRRAREWLP